MSNAFAIDKKSYTVYLSSNDKVSGTNNNGMYNINWESFLPRKHQDYKVVFSFQSTAGNYKDVTTTTATGASGTAVAFLNVGTGLTYSAAKILMNTQGRSYSFDTSNKSNSNALGYIQRDVQSATSSGNTLTAFYMQNTPKTISRPNQDMINIQILNTYDKGTLLLTDTCASSATIAITGYLFSTGVLTVTVIPAGSTIVIGTLLTSTLTTGTQVSAGTLISAQLTASIAGQVGQTGTYQTSYSGVAITSQTMTIGSPYGLPLLDMTAFNMIMEFIPVIESDNV